MGGLDWMNVCMQDLSLFNPPTHLYKQTERSGGGVALVYLAGISPTCLVNLTVPYPPTHLQRSVQVGWP